MADRPAVGPPIVVDAVLDARTCNASRSAGLLNGLHTAGPHGHDTSRCGQTPATAPAGLGANRVAVDRTTDEVYVTNTEDTSVSVIDGTKCNATNTSGCSHRPAKASVGGYLTAASLKPGGGSVWSFSPARR